MLKNISVFTSRKTIPGFHSPKLDVCFSITTSKSISKYLWIYLWIYIDCIW